MDREQPTSVESWQINFLKHFEHANKTGLPTPSWRDAVEDINLLLAEERRQAKIEALTTLHVVGQSNIAAVIEQIAKLEGENASE